MEWVGCVKEGERAFLPHTGPLTSKNCIKTGMNSPGIGQEPSGTFQHLRAPGCGDSSTSVSALPEGHLTVETRLRGPSTSYAETVSRPLN